MYLKLKKELWSEKINFEENKIQLESEIEKLVSINIIISQSIDFYEKLGEERAEHERNNKKKKRAKIYLDY